ncbi:MAG: exodeoxyribonuclease VII small subunit [Puniceicoccales bacterium]
MGQTSANTEELSFEDALTRLETLVDSLESGDIALAQLVEKYEEGSSLLKLCNRKLTNAELKIEQLRQDSEESATGDAAK